MSYEIGTEVQMSAETVTVVAVEAKRGRNLYTVRPADGSLRKTPEAFLSTVEFAPATGRVDLSPQSSEGAFRAKFRRYGGRL